jgi:multidrug efflux system membrane fusion protein
MASRSRASLSFIDNTVDPAAGTIKVKAEFDNRDTSLWPGQYVNAKVTVQTIKDAVVMPQNAIITNAQGTFVYVLIPTILRARCRCSACTASGLDAAVSGLTGTSRSSPRASRTCARAARCAWPPKGGRGGKKGGRRMSLSELCIRRPIMVVLLSISLILVGVLAYAHPGRGAAQL